MNSTYWTLAMLCLPTNSGSPAAGPHLSQLRANTLVAQLFALPQSRSFSRFAYKYHRVYAAYGRFEFNLSIPTRLHPIGSSSWITAEVLCVHQVASERHMIDTDSRTYLSSPSLQTAVERLLRVDGIHVEGLDYAPQNDVTITLSSWQAGIRAATESDEALFEFTGSYQATPRYIRSSAIAGALTP